MAEIRCPNCGKENPDFLDTCQFCQSPLPPSDLVVRIGEGPTPKSTGELEQILPDWLKEARQQGKKEVEKKEAEEEALFPPARPKVQQEPPDLLAGLISQTEFDEEELPDWLTGIAPSLKKEEPAPPSPQESTAPFPFLDETQPPADKTEWFPQETGKPAASSVEEDLDWLNKLGAIPPQEPAPAQPAAGEDLGWLRELEASAKETEEPAPSAAAPEEDLDWLNKLGAIPPQEPAPAQPAAGEDLSWLDKLGGVTLPEETAPAQPAGEDLDWLKNLSAITEPPTEPLPAQPTGEEDLSWLDKLGGVTLPEETAPAQSAGEDLDWLKDLGASEPAKPSAPAFADTGELQSKEPPASPKPFQTAPLNELLGDEALRDTTPDWLKEALDESRLPSGIASMGWLTETETPQKETPPTPPEPAASTPAFDLPAGDSSLQDLDALFNVDLPDWLTKAESTQPEAAPSQPFTDQGDVLAPAELPSWVQAMRPVESAISGTPAAAEMITEREGPLAGFRGVIPLAPIGSSLRPKAFSLKLQASEEQQAAAALLEQLIESETAAQPSQPAARVTSRHVLRWALSGLFLLVLSAVLWLGLRTMPIPPSSRLSDLLSTLPDASPVLVVIDYDPAFAGELEAAAGPLLDQLALSKRSTFEFIAASPTGSGLVERLMRNTNLSKPFPAGLGYRPAEHYFNLGYLPGGAAGAAGFIGDPQKFSRYAAIAILTDNLESSRTWIEQLEAAGPQVSSKPLIVVSSAQAAPMLQPYAASAQAELVVNGLYDAAKYEALNVSRPGTVRTYWDALGWGLMMAAAAIFIGGAWNAYLRFREQRNEMKQG